MQCFSSTSAVGNGIPWGQLLHKAQDHCPCLCYSLWWTLTLWSCQARDVALLALRTPAILKREHKYFWGHCDSWVIVSGMECMGSWALPMLHIGRLLLKGLELHPRSCHSWDGEAAAVGWWVYRILAMPQSSGDASWSFLWCPVEQSGTQRVWINKYETDITKNQEALRGEGPEKQFSNQAVFLPGLCLGPVYSEFLRRGHWYE